MTPEGRVKKKLKQALNAVGVYQHWPVQTGYGAATVDCIVCDRGRFVGIECKRHGIVRITPRQMQIMRQMRDAGAQTWLVTLDEQGELKWIEIND